MPTYSRVPFPDFASAHTSGIGVPQGVSVCIGALAFMTRGPALVIPCVFSATWLPSQYGNFFDAMHRQNLTSLSSAKRLLSSSTSTKSTRRTGFEGGMLLG